jgi:hypothetical protein
VKRFACSVLLVIVRDACVIKRDGWITVSSLAGLDVCLSVSVLIVYCLPSFKARHIISCVELLCFALLNKVAPRSSVNLEMALRQAGL